MATHCLWPAPLWASKKRFQAQNTPMWSKLALVFGKHFDP